MRTSCSGTISPLKNPASYLRHAPPPYCIKIIVPTYHVGDEYWPAYLPHEEVVLREAALVVAKMAAPEVDGLLDDWPSEGEMWIDSESRRKSIPH